MCDYAKIINVTGNQIGVDYFHITTCLKVLYPAYTTENEQKKIIIEQTSHGLFSRRKLLQLAFNNVPSCFQIYSAYKDRTFGKTAYWK